MLCVQTDPNGIDIRTEPKFNLPNGAYTCSTYMHTHSHTHRERERERTGDETEDGYVSINR